MDGLIDFLRDCDFDYNLLVENFACDACKEPITVPFYSCCKTFYGTRHLFCPTCFSNDEIVKKSFDRMQIYHFGKRLRREDFEFLDGEYHCVRRSSPPAIVNLDKKTLNIPPDLIIIEQCTLERAQLWQEIAGSLVEINPTPKQFGSLRQWTLFTDMTDMPNSSTSSGLLIDLIDFRIASVIIDNHGRVACNVVYNSLQEYQAAYSQWKENLKLEPSEREAQVKAMKECRKYDEEEWVRGLLMCIEFSQYVRLFFDLPQYYG